MSQTISIRREVGLEEPMHMRVEVTDREYDRMVELVESESITATEAYDKMKAEKKEQDQ